MDNNSLDLEKKLEQIFSEMLSDDKPVKIESSEERQKKREEDVQLRQLFRRRFRSR